jgi:hypothetical protein
LERLWDPNEDRILVADKNPSPKHFVCIDEEEPTPEPKSPEIPEPKTLSELTPPVVAFPFPAQKAEADAVVENEEEEITVEEVPPVKKRGRPKGSKNKPKVWE